MALKQRNNIGKIQMQAESTFFEIFRALVFFGSSAVLGRLQALICSFLLELLAALAAVIL